MSKEPKTPDVANYVTDPLKRQSSSKLRKIAEYCKALAEYKEHKNFSDLDLPETADKDKLQQKLQEEGPTIMKEKVKCGKEKCKCQEGELHGPYLYEYERVEGKVVSRYKGKP